MPPSFFETVLSRLGQFSEVTVEFNPEDAEKGKLSFLRSIGVNRISLGIQTFSDKYLKVLGRRQRESENLKALETVLSIFPNVSVDIIYGIPGQSVGEFLKDLEVALSYPIKHVSLYALTVYEETPFWELLTSGELSIPEENTTSEMYYRGIELLRDRGFKQYEISNFSLPGFESKHNINYWKLENYLGLGPSAASFFENTFTRNVRSIERYLSFLKRGELPIEETEEFEGESFTEVKLMMGLRLTEGVNVQKLGIDEKLKISIESSEVLKELINEGYIVYEHPYLRLGKKAYFTSNTVISLLLRELF